MVMLMFAIRKISLLIFIIVVFMRGYFTSYVLASQDQLSRDTTPETAHILLVEGFQIIDRKAKLVQHPLDNRWFLVFETFAKYVSPTGPITASGTPAMR